MGLLGLGGDALPREKRDLVAGLAAEFEGLQLAHQPRLSRYAEYRKENEAARESNLLRRASGTETDYGRDRNTDLPQRHHIPLPFGMALTVKHAHRIAGRLPDAIVDRREENALERYRSDTMEKMWWGMLHASGADTLFGSAAWDGSQLGASVLEVYFDIAKQMPYLRAIDPAGFIEVRGLDDPHDFQRTYRFWDVPVASAKAEYRDVDFDGSGTRPPVNEIVSTHAVGDVEMVTMVQMCDAERKIRFALGGSVPLLERQHDLGFTPHAVIPNIGPYRDVWGWADYEFVRALVAYIPQLLAREADILRMVSGGAYQDHGTGQDPEVIKSIIAKGGVLPTKRDRDARVEPIEAPQAPSWASEHADRALELMKMLGFAPDASWGGANTRSGPDRALQLQPLLELTAMKQTNWSAGLARLSSFAFQTVEKKQVTTATYRGSRPGATGRSVNAFKPLQVGPDLAPETLEVEGEDGIVEEIDLPRSPKELFDGDYSMRFVWQNRIDPDDPAYVLSELNKFAQGVQSLRTTLERLGFQAPEDEIKLIEQEAERLPWLRQGMIAMLKAELAAMKATQSAGGGGVGQGDGGGRPEDILGNLTAGLGMTQTKDGAAMDVDSQAQALPGGLGSIYGGA